MFVRLLLKTHVVFESEYFMTNLHGSYIQNSHSFFNLHIFPLISNLWFLVFSLPDILLFFGKFLLDERDVIRYLVDV